MDFDLTVADTAALIEECLYANAARFGHELDRNILRAGCLQLLQLPQRVTAPVTPMLRGIRRRASPKKRHLSGSSSTAF